MFRIHRSNRLERLCDALVDEIRTKPLDAELAPEWIAVQSLGARAFLEREIACRLGVFANTPTPFPADLVRQIAGWCDRGQTPPSAPLSEGALALAVFEETIALIDRPELAPVRGYVGDDLDGRACVDFSRRVAHAFSEYALYRPELVARWERAVPSEGWQPILFGAAMARLGRGAGTPMTTQAGLVRRVIDRLVSGGAIDLPRRVSLFGFASLPPLYLDVLAALARRTEVHLYVLCPSREFFGDVGGVGDNPLIASFGRLGRDLQNLLEERVQYVEPPADLFVDALAAGQGSLLGAIQSDLLHLRGGFGDGATPSAAPSIGDDDWSLKVCACRSPLREIEAVRDELLALLSDSGAGLRPEEIAVLAPDIAAYAPYIGAVFGGSPTAAGPSSVGIPHGLTRAPGDAAGDALEVAVALLGLTRARLTVAELFDVVALPLVRARFGIARGELEDLREAVALAGARFGIDAQHRGRLGLPALGENTWRFALDRVLLGLALSGEGEAAWCGVAPYDRGALADDAAVGRLVACVDAFLEAIERLGRPRPLAEWCDAVAGAVVGLCDLAGGGAASRERLDEALASLAADALAAGCVAPLAPEVIAAELAARARERETRQIRPTGVVCGDLSQLRGVPFRVICVVGLGDGLFPRTGSAPSFDLMAAEPRAGDRSSRDDDNAIFLETLLAARERLILTFSGAGGDPARALPSIAVSALLDAVAQRFGAVAERLVVRHPVEPFAAAYFEVDARRRAGLRSFDEVAYAAVAAGAPAPERVPAWPMATLSTDGDATRIVELDDLVRFFSDPSRHFCERVLGVLVPADGREAPEREPFALDHLARYELGARVLRDLLEGGDVERSYRRAALGGRIPVGELGRLEHSAVSETALAIAREVRAAVGEGAAALDAVRFEETLRIDGRACTVRGRIDGIIPGGRLFADFGKLSGRRLVRAWIPHLALNCGGAAVTTLCLRGDRGGESLRLPILTDARARLERLIRIFAEGQTALLPLFPEASYAYAAAVRKRPKKGWASAGAQDAAGIDKALATWEGPGIAAAGPGEKERPSNRLAWGEALPWEIAGDGPRGFRELATAVFGPLAEALEEAEGAR
jgi:exodeoxyribonuclease V gamma subunit